MTQFEDGPAKGTVLTLRRAPFFLRVVVKSGEVDALDQLDDTVRAGEVVFVYQLTGPPGRAFIDGKGGGRCCMTANYRLIDGQPGQNVLNDSEKWPQWVEQNRHRANDCDWMKGRI